MNKLVKIGFVTLAIVFSVISCSETTAQSTDTTQEVVKNSVMTMSIEGMTCAMGCARTIEAELKNVEGVNSAIVDFESAIASVEFNSGLVSEAGLIDFVNDYKEGSYKATSKSTKKACCASKNKACSSNNKTAKEKEGKSCSEQENSNKSSTSKSTQKNSKGKCTKSCCV
tara:strand:- start:175 stop:684 length:510 start_codon:yes stop_codon:yes gene_type:complete